MFKRTLFAVLQNMCSLCNHDTNLVHDAWKMCVLLKTTQGRFKQITARCFVICSKADRVLVFVAQANLFQNVP